MKPERERAEEEVAKDYALMLGEPHPAEAWREINRAIIDRWSVTALLRIKERAWQIVESGRWGVR